MKRKESVYAKPTHRYKTMFLLFFATAFVAAQEVISVTGGVAVGNEGSIVYSVGQLVDTEYVNQSGTVTHGVQQPYEISVYTGLKYSPHFNLGYSYYPNPVSDYLMLRVDELKDMNYVFHLYNLKGELLLSNKITSELTRINMQAFSASTYLLSILQDNCEVITYKVIKN